MVLTSTSIGGVERMWRVSLLLRDERARGRWFMEFMWLSRCLVDSLELKGVFEVKWWFCLGLELLTVVPFWIGVWEFETVLFGVGVRVVQRCGILTIRGQELVVIWSSWWIAAGSLEFDCIRGLLLSIVSASEGVAKLEAVSDELISVRLNVVYSV
ncbi:hypothetical protein Droror1_Dr00011984 [Drosera rotundifolia]